MEGTQISLMPTGQISKVDSIYINDQRCVPKKCPFTIVHTHHSVPKGVRTDSIKYLEYKLAVHVETGTFFCFKSRSNRLFFSVFSWKPNLSQDIGKATTT